MRHVGCPIGTVESGGSIDARRATHGRWAGCHLRARREVGQSIVNVQNADVDNCTEISGGLNCGLRFLGSINQNLAIDNGTGVGSVAVASGGR